VGGHIGGGMLTDSVSQNGAGTFNLLSSGHLRPAGVIGGAQLGANYEFAPWVVGIDGTWTDSAISGNTLIGTVADPSGQGGKPLGLGGEPLLRASSRRQLSHRTANRSRREIYRDLLVPGGATATTQVFTDNRTGFTVGAP
jgi:hypothetical protein